MKKSLKIPVFSTILFIIWSICIYKFYNFYNDGIQLAFGEHSNVIQFLIMNQYREKEMIIFSGLIFVLTFVHLFLIFYIYYTIKNSLVRNNKKIIELAVNVVWLCSMLFMLYRTVMFLVFIPLTLLAVVVVYLSYLIAKMKYGSLINLKENLIGVHGPFEDKISVDYFIKEVKSKNIDLKKIKTEIYEENNKYFVEYLWK